MARAATIYEITVTITDVTTATSTTFKVDKGDPNDTNLSANAIISTDDILLPIDLGGETKPEGTVTLGVGQTDTLTERVRIPTTIPAAKFYLGVLDNYGLRRNNFSFILVVAQSLPG